MMGMGGGMVAGMTGMMIVMAIGWLVVLAALVAGVWWFVRRLRGQRKDA